MSFQSLLQALRHRLAPLGRDRGSVRLQYLGMSDADLRTLQPLVEGVAQRLGVTLALDASGGDIVVVERSFASHVSTQALRAYCEDRPLVAIDVGEASGDVLDSMLERFEERQQDLLRQLREIPLVRRRTSRWGALEEPSRADARPQPGAPRPFDSGFDPGFDSRLDDDEHPAPIAGHQRLIEDVLHGLRDPARPRMWLGYGPGACMEVDFARALVRVDHEAEQRLRIAGELPSLAPRGAVPGLRATERALDLVVWDLGMACGGYRLRNQPPDWWHVELRAVGELTVERYTRVPRHLAMARGLNQGPCSPSALRRLGLVSVRELRCFLQACLFLGLVQWESASRR
jgi:hypothetical protein